MKKGCLITTVVIVVLASLGLGYYFYQQSKKDPDTYDVEKPVMTDIVKKTVATGAIKPRKEVQIKPQVSGVIDQIFIEEGQIVTKGQQLARVKLVPNEVNINSARSSVELSKIRYQEAQRELKRQQEVYNKNLDVESVRANLENAKLEEERQRSLFDDGIISEQEYNRYKLELELRQTEFDNAKIASLSDLRQYESEVDIRKQERDAAINNLQLLKEGATRNSGQVSNIVVATLEGMVLDIPVEEGSSVIERNNFNEGTSIAIIADMNSLIFEGTVDEADVGKLKEGMPLVLTVGAIELAKFDALLEHISPKGIEEEGTVKFEIRAAIQSQKDIFLRAGYSANADIILDKKEKVLAINERNLIFEEDSSFVEISVGDQKWEKRKIKTGLSDGIMIEVTEGLDSTHLVKVLKI